MDNGASSYRRFLDGDEAAFDEIMQELFYSLVYFINRYVQDIHAAEDIAMDVFADLIVHKNRYNFKVTLKTYLFMLGRSRAIDYLRRRKRARTVELSAADGKAEDERSFEEIIITDERKRALHSAMTELSDDMRVVIHLVYFEGLTYIEAARVMGKSKKQVDNLLYRAKAKLRTILGEDGEQL